MNHIDRIIKKYHEYMGHELKAFWNKERDRVYIYDLDSDKIIGICKNNEFVQLCDKYDLENEISSDYETLLGLMGYEDYPEGGD